NEDVMKYLWFSLFVFISLGAIHFLGNDRKPLPQPVKVQTVPPPVVLKSDLRKQLTNDTNKFRAEQGEKGLTEDSRLDVSAQVKCEFMQEKNFWAHDGGGKTWASFITVPFSSAGENLARRYSEAQVTQARENSPEHRENLLNKTYDLVGFGVCDGPVGHLIVQEFVGT